MPHISAGLLAGTLLAATILLPVPVTPAWASSATGHGVVDLGDKVLRIVSFSATSLDKDEGTATGSIEFQDPQGTVDQDVDGTGDPTLKEDAPDGVRLQANVDCLYVEGDHAVVGGQVTDATVSRYVGMWMLLFVEDAGRGAKGDKFSWGFYPAETDIGCGSFPLAAHEAVEIESGDLQVQQ